MLNLTEFIHPNNEILKYRVAQKLARTRPLGYNTKPSAQDYAMATAVLNEIAVMIAYNLNNNEDD